MNIKITDATASINKAKPKPYVVVKGEGYTTILTGAAFKKQKPLVARIEDIVDAYGRVTLKTIDALTEELENPAFVEIGGDSFRLKDIEKAKHVTGIAFEFADYSEAVLLSNGLLKVGCQTHPLSVWANTEPNGEWNASTLANSLAFGTNADARDALIPVLRLKLKELKAA